MSLSRRWQLITVALVLVAVSLPIAVYSFGFAHVPHFGFINQQEASTITGLNVTESTQFRATDYVIPNVSVEEGIEYANPAQHLTISIFQYNSTNDAAASYENVTSKYVKNYYYNGTTSINNASPQVNLTYNGFEYSYMHPVFAGTYSTVPLICSVWGFSGDYLLVIELDYIISGQNLTALIYSQMDAMT